MLLPLLNGLLESLRSNARPTSPGLDRTPSLTLLALATASNLCYCSNDYVRQHSVEWRRTPVGKIMAKAVWNGKVVAESDTTEIVEGNVYFPENSLKREFFRPSSTTSTCPWKGQARYLSLYIDGQDNPDAAWYYPDPKPAARKIKGFVAFWRGVEVEK